MVIVFSDTWARWLAFPVINWPWRMCRLVLFTRSSPVFPLTVIPLAWWIDGDRPSWRALVGGVVAVGAAAGMMWYR